MSIRVVLVDDHPVYRQGLAMLLAEDEIEVVGEGGTATEGLAAVAEHQPDVVVMDLHLPDLSGVEATRRILAAYPTMGVLVLTMDSGNAATANALRAGARGYLLKEAAALDVSRAVAAVARGELLVDAALAARLPSLLGAGSAPVPQLDGLSPREWEILRLVARGRSNAEVGRALFLAEKTVRNNVTTLLAKTGAPSRAALIALARDAGVE
jgi:DNA-binding NarL/FixJ family response regulator